MTDFAEAYKQNGIIIALDQEKAYNKVAHDYLFQCLQKYDFPPCFINTIRGLYDEAETRVMINGYLSEPFKVMREVWQGDQYPASSSTLPLNH